MSNSETAGMMQEVRHLRQNGAISVPGSKTHMMMGSHHRDNGVPERTWSVPK